MRELKELTKEVQEFTREQNKKKVKELENKVKELGRLYDILDLMENNIISSMYKTKLLYEIEVLESEVLK